MDDEDEQDVHIENLAEGRIERTLWRIGFIMHLAGFLKAQLYSSVNGINSNSDITKVRTWLELYGELLNDITEDSHFDPNPDSHKVGNGVYSVKMKIKKPIPNFLPPLGLKIRIN